MATGSAVGAYDSIGQAYRVLLAREEKQTEIDVEYIDVSPDEERVILATLDPLSRLSQVACETYTLLPLAFRGQVLLQV